MNDFQPVYPENSNLDPYKRVHYSNGLVLGVDEFNQEELYLIEKHQLHNRGLHGYGTVCGLKVTAEPNAELWDIKVAPGIAINPKGEEIRVPEAQCAVLNTWVNNNNDDLKQELGSPALLPASVPIYLVLCKTECQTDFVPVPSGPCQSLDKTTVASRIADDFELKFQLEPPQHIEDDKIQDFIELLRGIEISGAPGGLIDEEMERLVRTLTQDESPINYSPALPDHMHPDDVEGLIQVAMRTWVTEVKPQLLDSNRNCASGPPRESCVLLAVIDATLAASGSNYAITGVSVEEDQRPFLVQSRLLQEQLFKCCGGMPLSPIMTSPPMGGLIDESNLMHLTGDEIVTGSKTFNDSLLLATNGRVQRRLLLAPALGMPINSRVEHALFNANTPALRYVSGGETAFTLQIPDDIDYSVAPRVRLVWGVQNELPTLSFTWRFRNRFAEEEAPIAPYIGTGGSISDTLASVGSGRVYVTAFQNLPDSVNPNDIFGALRLELSSLVFAPVSPPLPEEIFILHIEISYVANRLGREI